MYIKDSFENHLIWFQDRFFYPKLPDERKWTFWQYTSRGRISGIQTYVDLNVFDGSEKDLLVLVKYNIRCIKPENENKVFKDQKRSRNGEL